MEHKLEKEGRIREVFIERCVLQGLSHPGIVKLYASFKQQRKFYFLLEQYPNGSLHYFMKR